MSIGETLYMKDMNISESDDGEEDMWDDRMLNNAYDKALRIANTDVAKLIAMATNSKEDKSKKNKSSKQNPCKNRQKWKPGMPCRAVYEDDGLEYEGNLIKLIDEKDCVVKFLGYENSEIVSLSSLKPTHGKDAQRLQIEQALCDKTDESLLSRSPDVDRMEMGSDRMPSPGSAATVTGRSSQRKKKSSKKKNQNQPSSFNGFHLPMPNFSLPNYLGSMDAPMPPPPPPGMLASLGGDDAEDQAVSSMLLSWYMSGYYAGLYQGLRKSKESSHK